MPVTFSPGEAETRPLHPKEIVYTTPQKVAELLGIGPNEAVLMSANAEANAVFVTGGDYRNTGFSVGDTILIYSDADPLGQEHAITAITTSVNGVKLSFAASINPGLYETADNAYVQNQASFTNGKTRGMKRSTVEARILEVQDKIDNVTHNAWRPYLVNAEYINFDTYKPYRRRYYTDYVGTTPLQFRNVQQILKLEIWQGNTYRELAGAGCTLKIEKNEVTGKFKEPFFFFGLPNGTCAKVGVKQSLPNNFGLTQTTVIHPGSGYSNQSGVTPTGGSGTGMTINTTVDNGAIKTVVVVNKGTGYLDGDILTISTGSADAKFKITTFDSGVNDNTSISDNFQDKVHMHQDFADTINEEDRAGKGAITFEPRFTLPGSTSNITLKDEIMAVANADYGNGVLKVTSMRQTKGGERNTIAAFSGTQGTISDVVTSKGHARFAGSITSLSITTGGSGYSAGTLDATGGSFQMLSIDNPNGTPETLTNTGKGVRVTVTVSGGVVNAITAINIPTSNNGQGFLVGDVIEFEPGGGATGFTATVTGVNANQSLSITNSSGIRLIGSPKLVPGVIEVGSHIICVKSWSSTSTSFTDITFPIGAVPFLDTGIGHEYEQLTLKNDLGDFSDSTTVVVDNGVETVVNTPGVGSQARLGDWWMDHEMGIIYFNNSYPFFEWNAVKVSYIYGERYLEKAIEEAATKMVAADLLMSDDRSVLIPEGTQNVDLGAKIQLYRKEAEDILSRYKEMVVFA